MATSELWANAGMRPFASTLAWRARSAIYKRFVERLAPRPDDTVLDVGVTCDSLHGESNFFEQLYPYKQRITCVGTEDASDIEVAHPGVRFTQVVSGEPLPFPAKRFKIAFSNAVVEHVGSREHQRRFVREILRVSERFFVVVPNRWFAIEPHTGLPLIHYLPAPAFRGALRWSGHAFWAKEENLNLLGRADLAGLFPADASTTIEAVGIGWIGYRSNIAAYGLSGDDVTN